MQTTLELRDCTESAGREESLAARGMRNDRDKAREYDVTIVEEESASRFLCGIGNLVEPLRMTPHFGHWHGGDACRAGICLGFGYACYLRVDKCVVEILDCEMLVDIREPLMMCQTCQ